jgi:hypothetical protein
MTSSGSEQTDLQSLHAEASAVREHDALLLAYQFHVEEHFWHVLHANPGRHLPYHNTQHLLVVAVNSVRAAADEGLTDDGMRTLFLAGLYHDWNHTGTADESKNIPAALEGFLEASDSFSPKIRSSDRLTVCELIAVTDSRHEITKPLTDAERIIRDADLSQWAEPDYEVFLHGLSEEFGAEVTVESTKDFLTKKALTTIWVRERLTAAGWVS